MRNFLKTSILPKKICIFNFSYLYSDWNDKVIIIISYRYYNISPK